MLSKDNFTLEHISELRERRRIDPLLLERSIYALGLLEALARVGMPFIFKGGTCLMLLLEHPRRLSTDIDIIVEPGTDVDSFIEEAAKIFPFLSKTEQNRVGRNNIVKRHFQFTYDSPVDRRPFYILLDILFEENHYSALTEGPIQNELLITEEPYLKVTMPTVDCILGDKLTAFAPHTTGIPFGIDKELEIIKQLYDVASLTEVCDSFDDIVQSYMATVRSEIAYRGKTEEILPADALMDTIEGAACIASRGTINPEEYELFLAGIHKIVNHIYSEKFSGERAVAAASKVMFMAACVLTNTPFHRIESFDTYASERISSERFKKLGKLRRLDLEAYAYIVEACRLLHE